MRPHRQSDTTPSLFSRLVGALTMLVFSAATAVAVPWLLAWKFPIRLGLVVGVQAMLVTPAAVLVLLSLVIGIFAQPVLQMAQVAAGQAIDRAGYIEAVAPASAAQPAAVVADTTPDFSPAAEVQP